MLLNFIVFVFCMILSIYQGFSGNVSGCILDIVLALLNLAIFILYKINKKKLMYIEIEIDKKQNEISEEIWSWNETYSDEWYHGIFSSKKEAIEDAISTQKFYKTNFDKIKVGKCEFVPLRTDVDPDRVLEDLDELYCDETGCEDYIYEGVTDEQRKWLEDKLSNVMVEFHNMIGLNPCWFEVVEQEEIDLCEYEKENL